MLHPKDIKSKVISTLEEFEEAIRYWPMDQPFIADVETFGTDPKDGKLLGIALCPLNAPGCPIYVSLQWYAYQVSLWHQSPHHEALNAKLRVFLGSVELVGHGYAYDKLWIDYNFNIKSKWKACTRLMWHIASAPTGPRPYGLKDAQVEVLGWAKRGDDELERQVTTRGGKLKNGDHYLADRETMGYYASLDAASTALLFTALAPFYDKYEYWWMLSCMTEYSWLLQECTIAGIAVNKDKLEEQICILKDTKAAYSAEFIELASSEINRLERMWRDDRATRYTIPAARERFLASWEMQKKFNLSSDKDKRELFYDVLKLPIIAETEGGKGSTGIDALKMSTNGREDLKDLMEAYEQAESSETLLNSFAAPWLSSIGGDDRLHPRFNPCGTVSYRLSGFKPYLLNAPFDEHDLMSCLKCDEGWGGIHADFVSVEPAVTAHYSQDPSLLKVFRSGLGDVYLDLARTLFPNDEALQKGYNPNVPITKDIKELFKEQRNIAKIIQLAVQYTGTRYTVHKNLTYAGVKITLDEADKLVQAYWRHFRKVAVMNEALFLRFERQGYLRNVIGRIIRVPVSITLKRRDGTTWEKAIPRFKDLPNRFIQSSAHDLLSLWVLRISSLICERGLKAKPMLLDCHDSTSWQAPLEEIEELEKVFKDALTDLNNEVKMSVPIKAEIKRFSTMAGLKGEDR